MIEERRVVDIRFPTGSYGSGYLLTDRIVLTARHVADPCEQGTRCIVRRWKLVDTPIEGSLRERLPPARAQGLASLLSAGPYRWLAETPPPAHERRELMERLPRCNDNRLDSSHAFPLGSAPLRSKRMPAGTSVKNPRHQD